MKRENSKLYIDDLLSIDCRDFERIELLKEGCARSLWYIGSIGDQQIYISTQATSDQIFLVISFWVEHSNLSLILVERIAIMEVYGNGSIAPCHNVENVLQSYILMKMGAWPAAIVKSLFINLNSELNVSKCSINHKKSVRF